MPAQNCYIKLQDASGLNTDSYQTDLETAACALIETFPEEFQDSFKVYDFGFYLHLISTSEGIENTLESIGQIAGQESTYYLLIAKILSPDNFIDEFRLSLNLPNEGVFDCMDEAKVNLIENQVSEKINSAYDKNDILSLEGAIQKGLIELKQSIEEINSGNCCPLDRETLEMILYKKGYTSIPAKFIDNPIETLGARNNEPVEDYANLLIKIKGQEGFDDFKVVLEREVSFSTDVGVNTKAFITKNENMCDDIGSGILDGFSSVDKEAYIHCHFSPNPDSSQWGLLFLDYQSYESLSTYDLPEASIIDDSHDCSPFSLPFVPENQYNYAIAKNNNEENHGFNYDAGSWNESDIVEGKVFSQDDFDKEKTWGDEGAYYSNNIWGITEYIPYFYRLVVERRTRVARYD